MPSEYRFAPDAQSVVRVADGAFIPVDPGNRDRQAYEQFLADGGRPDQYVAPVIKRYVPVYLARERLEAAGKWNAVVAVLANDMPKLVKLLSLHEGIDPDDAQVRSVLQAGGANPDAILAP